MKSNTKKVLHKCIEEYSKKHNIKHYGIPNPFPVSWRTISSLKRSAQADDNQLFSRTTQRKLLDFFKLAYRLDGSDFDIIEI